MDCDEPHLMGNEKMQPIQWTEQPTGALVAALELELETDLMKELELDFIFLGIRLGTRFPVLY